MARELQIGLDQVRKLIELGAVNFNFESLLERHYRRLIRPGDIVADVGAHTGRHLQFFSQLVGAKGSVVAFEPLPTAFSVLQKHFEKRFGRSNVQLHNVALGEREGTAEFTFARGTPEESGLRRRIFNQPENADPTTIEVQVRTLDSFMAGLPGLRYLKIDIEGGEIGCLRGARGTLQRLRPFVSVEYGFPGYSVYGHSKDTLYFLAQEHAYVLYDLFLNRLAEREDWDVACDSIYWDYFMVPREKEEEFVSALRA